MSETIEDIITEARGVFEELRKHGHEVVSVDRMESIIERIEKAFAKNDMELARIILKIRHLSEEIFTFSSILCRGMCERCPSERDCTSRKCRILIEELRQIANKE